MSTFTFLANIYQNVHFVISALSMPGLISEVELGAQSVVYGLANIAYMVRMSFLSISFQYRSNV